MSLGPLAAIAGACALCFGGALAAASALRSGDALVPVTARASLPARASRFDAELASVEPWRDRRSPSAVSIVLTRELAAQSRRKHARARHARRATHIPRRAVVVTPAPAPQPPPPPQPVALEPAPAPPAPAPVTPKPAPKPVVPKPAPAPRPLPPPTTTFFSNG